MVIIVIENDFWIKWVKTMTTFLYVYIEDCDFFIFTIGSPFKYCYIL